MGRGIRQRSLEVGKQVSDGRFGWCGAVPADVFAVDPFEAIEDDLVAGTSNGGALGVADASTDIAGDSDEPASDAHDAFPWDSVVSARLWTTPRLGLTTIAVTNGRAQRPGTSIIKSPFSAILTIRPNTWTACPMATFSLTTHRRSEPH